MADLKAKERAAARHRIHTPRHARRQLRTPTSRTGPLLPRPPPYRRHTGPPRQRPSQDRPGTARTYLHRHDDGHLLPRPAQPPGRSRNHHRRPGDDTYPTSPNPARITDTGTGPTPPCASVERAQEKLAARILFDLAPQALGLTGFEGAVGILQQTAADAIHR